MDKNHECPLCLELLEMDDAHFFPCKCGYQICRFCWHRIRTNENGLCPACRRHYTENPANFKPLTPEELQQLKNKKRQKDLKKKQKISESRKQLANIRVVQKNLVFVVGLPQRLVDANESEKASYFKQFGRIQKLIINNNTTYAGSQGPSSCAYVTYQKPQEAYSAVQAMNNSKIEGRNVKASLGTTKYCSNFLKKLHCPKQDCMYLHEIADKAASFTKEQIQLGKHLEYEQRLYEQISTNQNHNRKESSCSELTDSDDSLHKEKEDGFSNNLHEQNQKECVQTCNEINSSVNLTQSEQIVENQDHANHSSDQSSNQDLKSCLHCEIPNIRTSSVNSELDQRVMMPRNVSCDNTYMNSSLFSNMPTHMNYSSGMNHEQSSHGQSPHANSNAIGSQYLEYQSRKSPTVEADLSSIPSESNSPHLNMHQNHGRWLDAQLPEKQSLLPLFNNSEDTVYTKPQSPIPSGFNHLKPQRSSSLFYNSFHSSSQNSSDNFSHNHRTPAPFPTFTSNGNVFDGQAFHENHDDDLGFDPCQESLKGLEDLMIKEKQEAAKTTYSTSIKSPNTVIHKASDLSHYFSSSRNNSLSAPQRYSNPPPGFSLGNLLPSSNTGLSFANANLSSNRVSPVLNFHNQFQPVRPQIPINRLQQQNGVVSNISSENRVPIIHEGYEQSSRKSLNIVPQNISSCFPQPPYSNAGQTSPSSWNGVGQVNIPVKPFENNTFYNQSFIENRSTSPLLHMRAQQHNFNELSVRQLQQNGMKHDTTPFTDQMYAALLRNLQTGHPNGS